MKGRLLEDWRIGVAGGLILLIVGIGSAMGIGRVQLAAPAPLYIGVGAVAFTLGVWRFRGGGINGT